MGDSGNERAQVGLRICIVGYGHAAQLARRNHERIEVGLDERLAMGYGRRHGGSMNALKWV
jgi:hypothetical protein